MKASIAVILGVSTLMVGCTHYVDRPVPVASQPPSVISTPAIVEREKTSSSASGATAGSCLWASQTFSSGAMSCQNHMTYKCNSGTWEQQAGPAC